MQISYDCCLTTSEQFFSWREQVAFPLHDDENDDNDDDDFLFVLDQHSEWVCAMLAH